MASIVDHFRHMSITPAAELTRSLTSQDYLRQKLREDLSKGRALVKPQSDARSRSAQPKKHTIKQYIDQDLDPWLRNCEEDRYIAREDAYFIRCLERIDHLREHVDISEQAVNNMFRLLRGNLNYPVLLLQSPTQTQENTYEDMIEGTKTLQWVQEKLSSKHLSLDDVVILDILPLLQASQLEQRLDDKDVKEILLEFTRDFLSTFKPLTLISFQCFTSKLTWDVGYDNELAKALGSSVSEARTSSISELWLDDHIVTIVKGYHPSYIFFAKDQLAGERNERLLEDILNTCYEPCGNWKRRRTAKALIICFEDLIKSTKAFTSALQDATDMLRTVSVT